MICEHQESRKRIFTYLTVHLLEVCQGTPFSHERACPGFSRLYWTHGQGHGCAELSQSWKLYAEGMCYSRKTIAFMYNAFSLGFLLGTWRNVLIREVSLEPQPNWSTRCAKARYYAPPDREKQNKPNWGFMNTVGYPYVFWFLWCIWGWEKVMLQDTMICQSHVNLPIGSNDTLMVFFDLCTHQDSN